MQINGSGVHSSGWIMSGIAGKACPPPGEADDHPWTVVTQQRTLWTPGVSFLDSASQTSDLRDPLSHPSFQGPGLKSLYPPSLQAGVWPHSLLTQDQNPGLTPSLFGGSLSPFSVLKRRAGGWHGGGCSSRNEAKASTFQGVVKMSRQLRDSRSGPYVGISSSGEQCEGGAVIIPSWLRDSEAENNYISPLSYHQ